MRPRFRTLYRSLTINTLIPLALVLVLQRRFGMAAIQALAIAAVFPLGDIAFSWIRSRRLEPLGFVMLVVLVAGIVLSLISGDVRFALVKESFATGIVSLTFLGSLFARRPLIFWLGRQFSTAGDPAAVADWDSRWERPGFRRAMRLMTAVWGIGYLIDAIGRAVAAYALPPNVTIVLSPLSAVGVTLLLIVWTIAYARRRSPTG
ncbi:MAG: hypothetical protein JO359_05295 [Candidatus Eremiobacteraeota bacterium]|nr:hypothetical protein [Candidatus Eremiobacteraeota bacterium]